MQPSLVEFPAMEEEYRDAVLAAGRAGADTVMTADGHPWWINRRWLVQIGHGMRLRLRNSESSYFSTFFATGKSRE